MWVEYLHTSLKGGKPTLERQSRPLRGVGYRHALGIHIANVVGVGNNMPHQALQQPLLGRQIGDINMIGRVEGGVYQSTAVVRGGESYPVAAGHRYHFRIEGRLTGDVVAPVLPVHRVHPIVEELGGIEPHRLPYFVGIFTTNAGDVTKAPLNILSIVVEPALVEDAERRTLARHIEAGPKIDARWIG